MNYKEKYLEQNQENCYKLNKYIDKFGQNRRKYCQHEYSSRK